MPTTTPVQPSLRSHMPGLDGLRGCMLLLVLTAHFYFLTHGATQPVDRFIFHFRESGWFALDVFFVMSGFLITGILLDSKSRPQFFRNFYVRRFLRIFPIYYAALVAIFIVLPRLNIIDPSGVGDLVRAQKWYWSYLTNFLVATTREPPNSVVAYTRHLWSLAVEEQYYLVWPLVVYCCSRRRLVQICLALVAAALLFRCTGVALGMHPRALYVLTFSRMDSLATGSLVAVLVRQPGWLTTLRRWSWPAVGTVAAMGAVVIAVTGELSAFRPGMQSVGYTVVAIGAAGLVIIAATADSGTGLGRFLSHPIMTQLGTYSYATYVTHTFVYLIIQRAFPGLTRLPLVGGYGWPASLVQLAVLMAASISVGLLSWHLFEKHFLKLKRFFAYAGRPVSAAGLPVPGLAPVPAPAPPARSTVS
jgi:peptidoglycan/LPS O-acetylase OafA/YrhL